LIILGLTQYAEIAIKRLIQNPGKIKVTAFCELSGNNVGKKVNINGKSFPIINFAKLKSYCKHDKVNILLAEDAFSWNNILNLLRKERLDNIYIAPMHVYMDPQFDFYSSLRKVPMDQPMLTYYEYHTAEHCNLNCFQCGNFSNLQATPEMGDFAQYKRDIMRLKELFWNVGHIRFQGGEPLMNPQLPEFIRVTRETFPYADIGILSNGLLIPNADPYLFQAMRDYHTRFWLSGYPPTYKLKEKIEEKCSKENVPVAFMPLITEWRMESVKVMEMRPSNDWKAAEKWWRNCGARDSHLLKDGYLYYCCFSPPTMRNIYEYFGLDEKNNYMLQHLDELRFDLTDPSLDGWKIIEKLDHVHECCLYCVNRWPNFKMTSWKTCPHGQANIEDYVWNPPSIDM